MAVLFKIQKDDLNFKTNAQIRLAIGRVLSALADVYRAVDNSDNALRKGTRELLDGGRVALEKTFGKVPNDGNPCTSALALEAKNGIIRVRAEALTAQQFGNIDDAAFNSLGKALSESVGETATVVAETTKKVAKKTVQTAVAVAKETTKAVGEVAGAAASGVFAGLGLWSLVLLALAVGAGYILIFKPQIAGRLFGGFLGK